jgi:thymidine kinase
MSNSDTMYQGTLSLRIGPMISGKTTWLNNELTNFADKGFSVLKITHSDDIRPDVAACDASGSTHNSSYTSLSPKISTVRVPTLSELDVTTFHVIGVDEAQFFPDLVTTIGTWIETLGKHVRVVGLDGDAFKRKFGQVLDLIPMCDEVIKLNASCDLCLKDLKKVNFRGNISGITGPFTKRLDGSTEQKVVGGADKYVPVCRYHHSA